MKGDRVNQTAPFSQQKRRNCHFIIQKIGKRIIQRSVGRKMNEQKTTITSGNIPDVIISSMFEHESELEEIKIWNELHLENNNEIIRACPNYRNEGCWYDWVLARFEGNHKKKDLFPAKVLAIYENSNKDMKAIVHSVDYKQEDVNESLGFGDSRLVKHYRQEFLENGFPALRSIFVKDITKNIQVYQNIKYNNLPVPPRISLSSERKEHTIMVIKPSNEWAKMFVDWSRELKWRQTKNEPMSISHRLDVELSSYQSRQQHFYSKTNSTVSTDQFEYISNM